MTPPTYPTPKRTRVLSIAGTDPTGGAGIHADIKSIHACGGYAMAVITALVTQNTQGVRSINPVHPPLLHEQLTCVSDDVHIDSIKIGLIPTPEAYTVILDWLRTLTPTPPIVLDPVLVATSGDQLTSTDTREHLEQLCALVDLVTPNIAELEHLTNTAPTTITSHTQAINAGTSLALSHQTHVLVKGGHLANTDTATDTLIVWDPEAPTPITFATPRVPTRHTHGTGCSYSSAIATLYPGTGQWSTAITEAKNWLHTAIRHAPLLHVGHGNGPIDHMAHLDPKISKPAAGRYTHESNLAQTASSDGITPTKPPAPAHQRNPHYGNPNAREQTQQ